MLDDPLRHGTNLVKFSELKFSSENPEFLNFGFTYNIGVYPFRWEFELWRVKDQFIQNIICQDLLYPLVETVKAQDTRIALLRKL